MLLQSAFKLRAALFATLCISTPGCFRASSTASPRASNPSSSLARRDELLAEHTRLSIGPFVAALAAEFAPTGFMTGAGPDAQRGEQGATAWLMRDTLNARSMQHWKTVGCDVAADGRDGYSFGTLDLVRPAGDTLFGYFAGYWRRNDAGRWQLIAFGRTPRQRSATAWTLTRPSDESSHKYFPGTDSSASIASLFASEHAFNDSAGINVGRAFATFAAPTAMKPNGTGYATGPAEIQKLFADPAGGKGPTWSPQIGTVATSNDLGFTTGRAVSRDNPTAPGGRYFSIWKRQPNGTWRYIYD